MIEDKPITLDKIKRRIVNKLQELETGNPLPDQSRRERCVTMKDGRITKLLLRIPIISNLFRWTYRFIALPWRVESLDQKTDTLTAYLVSLYEKTDALHQKTDAIGKISDLVSEMTRLNEKLSLIKPVITAGDNIIVTKVNEFVMGFPAEDIRLAAALTFASLEPGLNKLLSKIITEGMVVVDVGAHIGLISTVAAQRVGRDGKVYCFEPTPRTFNILVNNIKFNGLEDRVIFKQLAVTDKKGKATFALQNIFGENTLFPNLDDQNIIEVETDSLDGVLHDVPRVNIVKIDAEGAEPFVLRGMKNIIEKNPHIIIFMEFAPVHLQRARVDVKEFIRELGDDGFSIHQVVEPSGDILPISEQKLLESFSVNLMLTRENSSES